MPLIAVLALVAAGARGQDDSPTSIAREVKDTRIAHFFGTVRAADQLPLSGAVVVSSAGGRTATDRDGRFDLEVDVPLEAECVQITAAASSAGANQIASRRVRLNALTTAPNDVGALDLQESTGCQPGWLPSFGGQPGLNLAVRAFVVFDDGSGPALYAGGDFSIAGGVAATSHIARWDGTNWAPLGVGTSDDVNAMAVFDDGTGPALFAGGSFVTVGDLWSPRIAKWNGKSWSMVPTPTGVGSFGSVVTCLTVFDDGNGPALYAGGYFTGAGGVPASKVARWDGTAWSALGSGVNDDVLALAVFDDGDGPALYAGGEFTSAGGGSANRIARWDGANWFALGSGVNNDVFALTTFDDGTGLALYVGGSFTTAGHGAANHVARWDGTSWSTLGGGVSDWVYALAVFDDGNGAALYIGASSPVGGAPVTSVAKWDGAACSALPGGPDGAVRVLAVHDAGDGPALFVGGDFDHAGAVAALNIASWNGAIWKAFGNGLNADLNALAVFDDGNGPALYAGGYFSSAGGLSCENIARWSGSQWSDVGGGVDGTVVALAIFNDGSGAALYAAGSFHTAGGIGANQVARWDGTSWSPLGSGLAGGTFGGVFELEVFDDGRGPALYAGGDFTIAGGLPANRVARWDGSSWSALGSGVTGSFAPAIGSMEVFDDGSGPALYVGGMFTTAGGSLAPCIARWDGASWSSVGSGVSGGSITQVLALAAHDDGSGLALYAGGDFSTTGGIAAKSIAKWDGSTWSPLGSGVSGNFAQVSALISFDDGSGPALFAGGSFNVAGGVSALNVARWDEAGWSPLGGGMSGRVSALECYDDGGGPALFAGGDFWACFDSGDSYLAKWGCPASTWLDLGHAKAGSQGVPTLAGTGSLESDEISGDDPCSLELGDSHPSSTATLVVGLSPLNAAFKGGTLVPMPWIVFPFLTSPVGSLSIPFELPNHVPSSTKFYFQFWISDPGASAGLSASNALKGLVP